MVSPPVATVRANRRVTVTFKVTPEVFSLIERYRSRDENRTWNHIFGPAMAKLVAAAQAEELRK